MNVHKYNRVFVALFVLIISFFPVIDTGAAPGLDPDDPPEKPEFAKLSLAFASLQKNGGAKTPLVPFLVEGTKRLP